MRTLTPAETIFSFPFLNENHVCAYRCFNVNVGDNRRMLVIRLTPSYFAFREILVGTETDLSQEDR